MRYSVPPTMQEGGPIPSWLNPMNWGVEDYSDVGDFNKAFEKARKAGKEQFMWHGKRFSTKSDMPLNQQQQVYGNNDAGLKADASLFNIRERASQTIAPRELTGKSLGYITENYIKPFIMGETPSGNVLTKKSIPAHYGKGDVDPQVDMFRKYMGLDQHFNTISESAYDKEASDFSKDYKREMLRDLKKSYGGFEGLVQAHGLKEDESKVVFDHKTRSQEEAQKTGKPYTGKATTLYPMGRYTESLKYDEDKNERYIEYRDKFDLNPQVLENIGMDDALNKLNNPYEIKGRIYESHFSQDTLDSWKNEESVYQKKKKFGGKIYDKENKNSYITPNKDSKAMPRYRKKLRRYSNPNYNMGGALKQMLPTAAGAAASFIPGAGPAVAPLVSSGVGALVNSGDKNKTGTYQTDPQYPTSKGHLGYKFGGKVTTNNQSDMLTFQNGGRMPITKPLPGGAQKYSGPKHEQGGVPVNNQGDPTSPETATAEVEGGETEQDGYVFSDTLTVPKTDGKTFAEVHEMMLNRGASKKDIKKLQMLQEKVQAQEGVKGGDDQQSMPEGKPRPTDAGSMTQRAQKVANKGATGKNAGQPAGMRKGQPMMRGGGKMKNYQNGGWTGLSPQEMEAGKGAEGEVYFADDLPYWQKYGNLGIEEGSNPSGNSGGGNWLKTAADVAGYAVPSIMKGKMALTNPDVKKTPEVEAQTVPVQSKAFTEGERSLASNYRSILDDPNASTSQKLAAQSKYMQGRSNLAGKEADFRSKQQQFNAQQQARADQINTQSFQRDRELQAKESASEQQMLMSAVTDPINAFRKNQAGKRSQIANIVTSANQIQNPTDRRNAIKRGLRAMGLDEQRIREIIARNETQ